MEQRLRVPDYVFDYVFVLYLRNIVLITSLYICSGAYITSSLYIKEKNIASEQRLRLYNNTSFIYSYIQNARGFA